MIQFVYVDNVKEHLIVWQSIGHPYIKKALNRDYIYPCTLDLRGGKDFLIDFSKLGEVRTFCEWKQEQKDKGDD